MAGLLKASSMIQPAYLSPHRKRKNPLSVFACKAYNRDCSLDSLGLKYVDGNSKRKPLRTMKGCSFYTRHIRLVSFARPENWLTSLNFETSFPQLSSTLKALPTGSLGLSSAPLYSSESMEPAVPGMMHPLLKFLLEAYLSFPEQALVATTILAAVVVAAFVAKSGDESHLKRVEKSLVFISRPSQFNRFVSMRCPSMSMNISAKNQVLDIEYQRMCLHAPDGGIVAIDWPAEIDFVAEKDHLANTLLLVPGTTEGSEDEGVKQFVIDAMRYGFFPVVLNPRGCASSPVTTPRVFSGTDSDDVRLVVQHLARGRPGSSVMGVGWGWGANMLTKYLGEEAGSTSLMAAVAISNPFDLQQSSMYLGMTNAGQLDRLMAQGLVNILKENKVLFAGQNRKFNLKAALASTSIRDFDASISRVTHGFDTIDEFYASASSARYISSVQVPLLFVQGEDFSMPVTSVPYSNLEANPYTAALVSQNPASNKSSAKGVVREPGSASRHRWSHTVAFEWLAAVEVALLKGHHPLLNSVSSYEKVSIESNSGVQPSLSVGVSIEGNAISSSRKDSKMDTSAGDKMLSEDEGEGEDKHKAMRGAGLSVLGITGEAGGNEEVHENDAAELTKTRNLNSEAENIPSNTEVPPEAERIPSNTEVSPPEAESISAKTKSTSQEAEDISSKSESTSHEAESIPLETKSLPPQEESTSSEPTSPPPEGEPEEAAEIIQMRAAAESIMNVLDITMPGTLSDEKKAQVLTAVGDGETVLTALQEAVPEEVRGSMAAAVSGAVQARGLSFNRVGFGTNMPPPTLPAGLIESIKGKIAGGTKKESTPTTPHSSVDGPIAEGTRDTNSKGATSSEKSDGEGHAVPDKHDNESQKADNQETENKIVNSEDKSQSVGEKRSKGDSKDSKEPKSEEPKDSSESKSVEGKHEESKLEEAKESTEGKPLGGKHDEPKEDTESKPARGKEEELVDKHEKVEQTEDKKNGAQEAPDGEVAGKDEKKPDDTGDTNGSLNAKEETKPAEEIQVSPDTPVPAPAAASPPPSPGLESIIPAPGAPPPAPPPGAPPPPPAPGAPPPPAPGAPPPAPPPDAGGALPLNMGSAFQALTGFDDSTQMAVTNVFGVVEGMLEKMEQEQQTAAVPDASANAKETSDDEENKNDRGNDTKKDDRIVVNDSPPEHNEEDGTREIAAVVDTGRSDVDGGDDDSNTHENAKSEKRESLEVADKKQEVKRKGKKIPMSVPDEPRQVTKNLANVSSSNQGSGKRPQSGVMMIQRVGSSTLVEPVLKDQALETRSSVNGALANNNGASLKQESTETHQIRQPVKEAGSLKPVTEKMTIEQLSQEVDQERMTEGDDSSPKANEVQEDQTIEVEVTGIKETKTSNKIENIVKNALKLEVLRRLGVAGMESLGIDLEQEVSKVAASVADAVQRWKKDPGTDGSSVGKLGILSSNSVMNTLGTVMGGTQILGGLVPVGVLAGVILASLSAVYLIVTDNQQDDGENDKVADEEGGIAGEEEEEEEEDDRVSDSDSAHSSWQRVKASALDVPVLSANRHSESPSSASSELEEGPWLEPAEAADDDTADAYDGDGSESEGSSDDEEDNKRGKVMGMMAVAVTGGATLARMSASNNGGEQQDGQNPEGMGKEAEKGGSIISGFHPLAEKALSVAAPVVPYNEDGEIDHERLVAMLAELGQRGGFLRLIGKVALLWGGLRGAMSLTDRLLVFLQINKRPLHLRLVGFAAMVVLLWSPVLIPVLPSLLQQWATKAPGGVADAASAVGLYGAILILVTIWGKRVRGYDKPLLDYGLRLWSKRKVQDLGLGLALGGGLVSFSYIANFILGYAHFNWGMLLAANPKLPGTIGVALFTTAKVSKLVGKAVAIGLAVALVEEVLFRAWLQEEIAVDLGFHTAVFTSAIAFALLHRSPAAIPGLWFLSVSLAGARAKMNRNLAFPIGLHAGLVAVNYVMTTGGLVQYMSHAPIWFTGAHLGNPLAGALGTGTMALLAVILYPRTVTHPLPAPTEVEPAVLFRDVAMALKHFSTVPKAGIDVKAKVVLLGFIILSNDTQSRLWVHLEKGETRIILFDLLYLEKYFVNLTWRWRQPKEAHTSMTTSLALRSSNREDMKLDKEMEVVTQPILGVSQQFYDSF